MQQIPLLMTRSEEANARFAEELPSSLSTHFEFISCPLTRIVSLGQQNSMQGDGIAIFTSANGVRFAPPSLRRKAFCVGERTTAKALAAGWQAVCAGQCAKELIDHIKNAKPTAPMHHFSGVHVRGEIVENLTAIGLSVKRIALYDQVLLPLSQPVSALLSQGLPVVAPLFSPRAAAHFCRVAPSNLQLVLVALSAAVAEAGQGTICQKWVIADQPNADAMVDCLEKLARTMRLG
ncbi:MAG: uroporphyrinogen-III synthase [Roseobacter sp.]